MVRLLNRYRAELGVTALPAELEADGARDRSASCSRTPRRCRVAPPQVDGGTLSFDVEVRNLTGHKFPTGYPSRRTWLHVDGHATARAASSSNRARSTDAARSRQRQRRRSRDLRTALRADHAVADQVQIYESILGDRGGAPTTGLLTATQYLKDNRLLPRGFDKATADPQIGVYGAAARDADFAGAGDRVRYRVAVDGAGPYPRRRRASLSADRLSLGANLRAYDAPEPRRFVSLLPSHVRRVLGRRRDRDDFALNRGDGRHEVERLD